MTTILYWFILLLYHLSPKAIVYNGIYSLVAAKFPSELATCLVRCLLFQAAGVYFVLVFSVGILMENWGLYGWLIGSLPLCWKGQ